ncbi:MAG TPA: right-handed parallel beta-helix repeat-containing protein [Planctomycetota bacterium]
MLIAVSFAWLVCPLSAAEGDHDVEKLFVAPTGNNTWSGRRSKPNDEKTDGPLATLESARDALRKLRKDGALSEHGVTVEIRAGTYELGRPLELTKEDSGSAAAPVRFQAQKDDEVRICGGRAITGWSPVSDPAALARIDEGARAHVLRADLKAQGVTDLGEMKAGQSWAASDAGLEVFFQDKPMTLARWPNEGFVKIVDVVGGAPHRIHGVLGDKLGIFTYEGDRPKRWVNEKNVILDGYWFWDWANQRQRIESIDAEKRIITLALPLHAYGYRKDQWYYALNLLPELDAPGEWYLDREGAVLYFWPPAPIEKGRVMISMLPALVNMKDASHVTFAGMIFEGARGNAIDIAGGTSNQIEGCVIRNVGSWAVTVNGGSKHTIVACDIYATGDGGISLSGGDRKTLTPAEHVAENNHIHHYSRVNRIYKPGITLNGVGNRASHNLIHNAPHMAMGFGGNDHVIEFNEIHSVCYESNDAGAIYTGRDWTFRGNVLRYNYLHHLCGFQGRGCNGIYLDDQMSSALIFGNLFYKTMRPAFIGGGRDCTIENNIFVDCSPALHIDARGLGWAKGGFDGMVHSLKSMPYQSEPWTSRYPELVKILDEDPMAPKNDKVLRNICWGGKWDTSIEGKAKPGVSMQDNLVQVDPLFEDAAKENFQLRDDSPAYKLGFKRLPLEKIGLYKDKRRASWPVEHTVRPMETPPAPEKKK